MRGAWLIVLFAIAQTTAGTQTLTDRDEVLKVVQAFFDTMMARDVEGAQGSCSRGALLRRRHAKAEGGDAVARGIEEYFKALQQGKSTRRERMWSPEVRVHGAIATVWTPYDFWIDGRFSHCGVDAFDLIKATTGGRLRAASSRWRRNASRARWGPREVVDSATSPTHTVRLSAANSHGTCELRRDPPSPLRRREGGLCASDPERIRICRGQTFRVND